MVLERLMKMSCAKEVAPLIRAARPPALHSESRHHAHTPLPLEHSSDHLKPPPGKTTTDFQKPFTFRTVEKCCNRSKHGVSKFHQISMNVVSRNGLREVEVSHERLDRSTCLQGILTENRCGDRMLLLRIRSLERTLYLKSFF